MEVVIGNFYEAALAVKRSNLLICFCSFDLSCPITISCIYLFLTPNSQSAFRVGVSLNIHSFIHCLVQYLKKIFVTKICILSCLIK